MAFMIGSCAKDSNEVASPDPGGNDSGQGGSMARFTIVGDYLYAVDSYNLNVFSLEDPAKPEFKKSVHIGLSIETIYEFDQMLFIGSEMALYIFDVAINPVNPKPLGTVSHFRSCDPVVAAGTTAYVTLNSGSSCWNGGRNALIVYDITNPRNPIERRVISEGQQHVGVPRGLGVDIDAKRLFVCDNGINVYDISDPENPVWESDLSHINDRKVKYMDAYDVIVLTQRMMLIAIGEDGLRQFKYSGEELEYLGGIDINF